ncbi:hypothetical protein M758_1G271500 [Ceratodon purpureus]|nr:hypothetical protein M758_1G271500 [Ceratodon purpureus]
MDESAYSRELLRIVRTANAGQIEGLRGLVDVNVRDRMGRTPLHLAVAFNKNPEVVRALLSYDRIEVNAVDELGRSPLHLCVNSHKEELLRPGEASKQSAASLAQVKENIELLTGRMDLAGIKDYKDNVYGSVGDYEDDDSFSHPGGTGYYEANVELTLAEMLLDKGADVNKAALLEVTPLHLAARLGQVEMVELLLRYPTLDLKAETVDKHTVLHLVTEGHQRSHIPAGMKKPTMEDLCKIIRLIRKSSHPKSDLVNMPDRLGLTALHFAARDGCVTLVKELLEFNETNDKYDEIEVNARDVYTFSALHLAVLGGYTAEDFLNRPKANFKMGPLTSVVDLLLKFPGIDINLQAPTKKKLDYEDLEALTDIHTDYFFRPMSFPFPISGALNNTALHLACKDGRDPMVRLLLHQPQVNLKLSNSHQQTALQLATYNGHLEVVKQVLVHYAAREGYRNVVETLLPPVDNLDALDTREKEERKIIEAFLKAKEEELGNVQDLDTKPMFTILIDLLGIASEQGHGEMATFLVETLDRSRLVMAERGAKEGILLHWAAENGELAIVQDVMTPESINAQDEAGFTALHYAILGCGDPAKRENCFQVLKELLSSPDLDVNSHGVYGKTPLHLAVAKSDVAVVRLLCTEVGERLRANEVDDKDKTPLEIAVENLKSFSETAEAVRIAIKADKTKSQEEKKRAMEADIDKKKETAMRQIEMLLLDRGDVQDYMDRLFRDRQMYVDASNSLLVGAALIAGAAFVGWLQPPSGYTDEGVVKTSTSALCFFLFNALAFFGGMGAVISGADGALLDEETFIRAALETTRSALMWTISLLIISVVCVLGAFVSAGVVVFPLDTTKRKICFFLTLVVGVVMCFLSVSKFAIKVLKKMKNRTRLYKSKHLNEDGNFLP